MRVCKRGCDVSDFRVLCLQSLILTRRGLGEFSKVMQTLDYFSGLHNCLEFSQPSSVFRLGYVNTEKVLNCLNNFNYFRIPL